MVAHAQLWRDKIMGIAKCVASFGKPNIPEGHKNRWLIGFYRFNTILWGFPVGIPLHMPDRDFRSATSILQSLLKLG
jgi:hypothetical protein